MPKTRSTSSIRATAILTAVLIGSMGQGASAQKHVEYLRGASHAEHARNHMVETTEQRLVVQFSTGRTIYVPPELGLPLGCGYADSYIYRLYRNGEVASKEYVIFLPPSPLIIPIRKPEPGAPMASPANAQSAPITVPVATVPQAVAAPAATAPATQPYSISPKQAGGIALIALGGFASVGTYLRRRNQKP